MAILVIGVMWTYIGTFALQGDGSRSYFDVIPCIFHH